MNRFNINITASGYNWTPAANGIPPATVNYQTPLNAQPFAAGNYLVNNTIGGNNQLFQEWKFAPTADYPIYCGQSMGSNANLFKLMAIDLKVGIINGTWWSNNYGQPALTDGGLAKITYNITSSPSSGSIIAFNVYAYNNQTITQQPDVLPPAINWLNKVSGSGSSGWEYQVP